MGREWCSYYRCWIFAELGKVPDGKHSRIYTPGSGVQLTQYNFSMTQDKVLAIETQAAKVASSPSCRGVMRLLDLTN